MDGVLTIVSRKTHGDVASSSAFRSLWLLLLPCGSTFYRAFSSQWYYQAPAIRFVSGALGSSRSALCPGLFARSGLYSPTSSFCETILFISFDAEISNSCFCRRVARCGSSEDIVAVCRKLPGDAEQLSDSMMQCRLYKLKMPQLRRFWEFSPKFVLCVCPRDQDVARVFVKRDTPSARKSAGDDAVAPDSAHSFAVRGAQRWRHIHSASLVSIAAGAGQPLPPARAAKVFSWVQSGKLAWESPDNACTAWQATFRDNDASRSVSAEALPASDAADDAADEYDLNRWVSKSISHSSALKLPVLYEISVVTGSDFGAGTDSQVFCSLYGEDGLQSPELPLAVSINNKDPFETGQLGTALLYLLENFKESDLSSTDTFRHVIPPIGRVASIRIRFDATGHGECFQSGPSTLVLISFHLRGGLAA
jgi:hypothetical protein